MYNSLIEWAQATPGFLSFSRKVMQGGQALVVFATIEGEEQAKVLVLSKGLSETVTAGTPVTKLINCTVTEGENAQGEKRIYIGRPAAAGEDGLTLEDLKAAAGSDLPF